MNTTKLLEAITELETEAKRCKDAADELRVIYTRFVNGSAPAPEGKSKLVIPPRANKQRALPLNGGEQKSVRTLALELIELNDKPLHVDTLVELINERRHEPTNRAAVESQLVRAIKAGKFPVKRTGPGTYGVA